MNWLFTQTPLAFFVQSFWRDEAFSYLLAKKNILDIFFYTARDFNPPLYYVLLHIWMNVFGSSEIALRSLSLIFYWATLYVMFDFMHDMLKIPYKRCVIYLLVFMINPILVYYAYEARMYTMLAFLAMASWYCLLRPFKRLYILSAMAGMYTHYFMAFVIMTQVIYVFFIDKEHTLLTHHTKKSYKELLKTYTIMFLLILPWMIYAYFHRQTADKSFWIPSLRLRDFFLITGTMYTGLEPFFDYLYKQKPVYLFSIVSLTFIILAIVISGHRRVPDKKMYYALALWAALPPILVFLISFIQTYFLPRYLIFSSVGLLLLVAYSLEHIRPLPKRLFLVLLVLLTLQHVHLQLDYRKKEDLGKKIKEIRALAKKDDVLYVTDVLDFQPAQYYFGENKVFIYNKQYSEVPQYIGKTIIPPTVLKYTFPPYPRKAFILKQDRSYEVRSSF